MKKHTTTIPHCKYCGLTKSGTGKGLVMHELDCLENPDNFKQSTTKKEIKNFPQCSRLFTQKITSIRAKVKLLS
jgi:hypothetical protein